MTNETFDKLVGTGAVTQVGIAGDAETLSAEDFATLHMTQHEAVAEFAEGADEPTEETPDAGLTTPEELGTTLIDDLKNGGQIVLKGDTTTPKVVAMTKDTELDLNGKELVVAVGSQYGDAVQIQGATVTLKNGTIGDALNNAELEQSGAIIYVTKDANVTLENMNIKGVYPVWLNGENNTMTIKGGTYHSTATQGIYVVKPSSKIIIEDGEFYAPDWNNANFCLNLKDGIIEPGKKASDYICVRGGKFINFNPADSHSENPAVSFVDDGYKVGYYEDDGNIIYVVYPDSTKVKKHEGHSLTWYEPAPVVEPVADPEAPAAE